jgi:hypothetical protein
MIEVFKTNVTDPSHACKLVDVIQERFPVYKANFDLDDCDNILRIESGTGTVTASLIIDVLKESGYDAEILMDEIPVYDGLLSFSVS